MVLGHLTRKPVGLAGRHCVLKPDEGHAALLERNETFSKRVRRDPVSFPQAIRDTGARVAR